MTEYILSYLIDADSYKHQQKHNDYVDAAMSYSEFVQWNMNCLYDLSSEELLCVQGICELIQQCKINTVGMKSSEKHASGIYYNINKCLCIFESSKV